MSTDNINSKEYWEQRFQTDWRNSGGPSQSRFFSRVALDNMPDWFVRMARIDHLTVCDWGCAEGSGTSELAAGLSVPVTGVDFSADAIASATSAHGHLKFLCRDVLVEDMPIYDIVFSSNTLEHFQEPWRIFDRLSGFARLHVVMLLPFEEYQRISEHFHTFDANDMAFTRGEFVLTHAAVEDLSGKEASYWNGKQILVIYTRADALQQSGITLANIRIDGQSTTALLTGGGLRQLVQAQTRAEMLVERVGVLEYEIAHERKMRLTEAAEPGEIGDIAKAMLQIRETLAALDRDRDDARCEIAVLESRYQAAMHEREKAASAAANAAEAQYERLSAELEQAHASRAAIDLELTALKATHAMCTRSLDETLAKLGTVSEQLARQDSSLSWRLTHPLRFVRALLVGSRPQRRELLYSAMRSGYWRLPERTRHSLMGLRGRFVRNRINASNPAVISTVTQTPTFDWVALANSAAKVAIVPCAFEFDELVNQRPINLAKYLTEHGYLVVFVAWQWHRDERLLRSGSQVFPGIWQIGLFDLIDSMSGLDQRSDQDSIFFVTLPAPILVRLHEAMRQRALAVVYDILDEWEEFSKVGQAPWFDRSHEQEIVLVADAVAAVSPSLAAKFADLRSDIHVIGNGYEGDALGVEHAQCARRARSAGRPMCIGYFGHLTDAWFDWDMVLVAARMMPETKFEIIGYGEPEWVQGVIAEVPNVSLLGKIPPSRLWEHAQFWHVALVPFKTGPLAAAVDPIKVYEYLYLGLPTVCTGIPHLASLPAVRVVDGAQDFVVACQELARADLDYPQMLSSLSQATWNARFDTLLRVIKDGAGIRSLYVA